MNKINLENQPKFFADKQSWEFVQQMVHMVHAIGGIAGGNFILSGCEVKNGVITEGFLVINSEILPFSGGVPSANVFIQEEKESVSSAGEKLTDLYIRRQVKFGSGTPANTFKWGEFIQINVKKIMDTLAAKADKSVVSVESAGLMSIVDKVKLDGIATGANLYTHPSTHAPSEIKTDDDNSFVSKKQTTAWDKINYTEVLPSESIVSIPTIRMPNDPLNNARITGVMEFGQVITFFLDVYISGKFPNNKGVWGNVGSIGFLKTNYTQDNYAYYINPPVNKNGNSRTGFAWVDKNELKISLNNTREISKDVYEPSTAGEQYTFVVTAIKK